MFEVSVVIVNYNAGNYLQTCLQSLWEQTFQNFEVILIDNCSSDNSQENIDRKNNLKIIKNSNNQGFARAQNQGFRLSQARFVMPLNFDILLTPTFLHEMLAAINLSPKIGSVSPKLLHMEQDLNISVQIDNAGLLLPPSRFPLHRGGGATDTGQFETKEMVFGAMGASALYRREMLEDIAFDGQYFDEHYFMWFEDIDLEWRARLRGWKCIYAPSAVAYHVGDPHGHGKSQFGSELSIRNRWMMILSNECAHCGLRNLLPLLAHEAKLIRHVLKFGLVRAYIKALIFCLRSFPSTIKKRNWVRSRAIVKCLPEFPQLLQESKHE